MDDIIDLKTRETGVATDYMESWNFELYKKKYLEETYGVDESAFYDYFELDYVIE